MRINYDIGDVFLIPDLKLPVVLVVTHMDSKGGVFGKAWVPDGGVQTPGSFDMPHNPIWEGIFGDLYILNGRWKKVGRIQPEYLDRTWPTFYRMDYGGDRHMLVERDPDTLEVVRETLLKPEELESARGQCVRDAICGAGAVEIRLKQRLKSL